MAPGDFEPKVAKIFAFLLNATSSNVLYFPELNTVGQIPGSVVLPLHEVSSAMELSSEEFLAKYKFAKPDPLDRKIVLTCRSGRRVLVSHSLQSSGD